jgi:hypothetical protein
MLEAELRIVPAAGGHHIPDFAPTAASTPTIPAGVGADRRRRLAGPPGGWRRSSPGRSFGVGALLPGTAVDDGAQLVLDETGRQTAPRELGVRQLVGARARALTRPPPSWGYRVAPEPTTTSLRS